jgi:hypothetical protein
MSSVELLAANAVLSVKLKADCKSDRKTLPSAVGVRSIIGTITFCACKSSPKPTCDGNKRRTVAWRLSDVTLVICGIINRQ